MKNKIRLAELFLKKSKQDISSAKVLLKSKAYGDCCYFCQQSAEKSVKAVLIAKTGLYPRDHIVSGHFTSEVLAFTDPAWVAKLRPLSHDIVDLEEYWLKPKYPYLTDTYEWDPVDDYMEQDAAAAIEKAEKILETLEQFLKEQYMIGE